MVNTVTGLGGWFHNFGGLSTPLIMWLKAYYTPGTVNAGFDTYLEKTVFNDDKTDAEITFTCYGESKKFNLLCVMKEDKDYTATVDGKEFPFKNENGLICFEFDFTKGTTHTIKIQEIK